jgi:ISXO2-like transposase domain
MMPANHQRLSADFAGHFYVNHMAGELSRAVPEIHTNTIEGFFSIFKRGMKGVYQHCGKRHLHRYMAEFDFRHSHRVALGIGDTERADHALRGIVGKRLTYETIGA